MKRIYHFSERYASIIRIRKEFLFLILNCFYWAAAGCFAGVLLWLFQGQPRELLVSYMISISSVLILVFGYIGGMIRISKEDF